MSGVNTNSDNITRDSHGKPKYTLIRDTASATPTPMMTVEKATSIYEATKKMTPEQYQILTELAASEQAFYAEQNKKLGELRIGGQNPETIPFDRDAFLEKRIVNATAREQFVNILNKAFDPQHGGAATLENITDVMADVRERNSLGFKGRAINGPHGVPEFPPGHVRKTSLQTGLGTRAVHSMAKVGGIAAGLAVGGVAAASTLADGGTAADAVEAGADTTPLHIAIAAGKGEYGEAVISGIEQVPVAGFIVGGITRSLVNRVGGIDTVDQGIFADLGGLLGRTAYDLTHTEEPQNVDLSRLNAAGFEAPVPEPNNTQPQAPQVRPNQPGQGS